MVERELELEALDGVLAAARRGGGRGVLVQGPAGIGKSALLAAAVERARDAGMLALTARGGELERAFGFGVVRQLFELTLATLSPSKRRSLLSGAARFAAPALEVAEARIPDAVQPPDPFSVMHGLYWLVVNLSAARPVLVCVDDGHWADVPSLRWLVYLVRRLEGTPVAVAIAARPAEAEADAAGAVLAALRAEPALEVLRPSGLTEPAVAALTSSALRAPAAPAFARACHRLTAGNAFLVSELLRAIAAEGLPADEAGVTRLAQLAPHGVSAAVLLRLSRLSAEARGVAVAVMLLEPPSEGEHSSCRTTQDQRVLKSI